MTVTTPSWPNRTAIANHLRTPSLATAKRPIATTPNQAPISALRRLVASRRRVAEEEPSTEGHDATLRTGVAGSAPDRRCGVPFGRDLSLGSVSGRQSGRRHLPVCMVGKMGPCRRCSESKLIAICSQHGWDGSPQSGGRRVATARLTMMSGERRSRFFPECGSSLAPSHRGAP